MIWFGNQHLHARYVAAPCWFAQQGTQEPDCCWLVATIHKQRLFALAGKHFDQEVGPIGLYCMTDSYALLSVCSPQHAAVEERCFLQGELVTHWGKLVLTQS